MSDEIDQRLANMTSKICDLRDRLVELEVDGYSTNMRLAGDDRESRVRVRGEGGDVRLTQTEAAADARMNGKSPAKRALKDLMALVRSFEHQVTKLLDRERWAVKGEVTEAPDVWCEWCDRHGFSEPQFRATLCDFCYGWQGDHNGVKPPPGLLALHHKGVRLTARVVARFEAGKL